MRRRILIYGATGYTGRLIAEHARYIQGPPVIAGRSAHRVQALAAELGLEGRVIAFDQPKALDDTISDVGVLINAASPFAKTAPALIESCLRTGTHYVDVTGELDVFQHAFRYDKLASKRGIMIMPGVGLGIVASDCLAMHVAAGIPNAKYLRIGLLPPVSLSQGTIRSAFGLSMSQVSIRRNGRIISVPAGRLHHDFDYGEGKRASMAVSWADVFTAYYSTGIRNIEAYFEAGFASRMVYHLGSAVADALRQAPVERWLGAAARTLFQSPSEQLRKKDRCVIVAEAEDSWRRRSCARLETPDGYSFTAQSATMVAERIRRGDFLPGFQTPGKVYGPGFVLGMEGTSREDVLEPDSSGRHQ
jgi:short subunit dehydrogenase-like uncharacterized protein